MIDSLGNRQRYESDHMHHPYLDSIRRNLSLINPARDFWILCYELACANSLMTKLNRQTLILEMLEHAQTLPLTFEHLVCTRGVHGEQGHDDSSSALAFVVHTASRGHMAVLASVLNTFGHEVDAHLDDVYEGETLLTHMRNSIQDQPQDILALEPAPPVLAHGYMPRARSSRTPDCRRQRRCRPK